MERLNAANDIRKEALGSGRRHWGGVVSCFLLVLFVISRAQEIFPSIAGIKPVFLLLALSLVFTVLEGKFTASLLWGGKEGKLLILFWLLAMLSIPFSVYRRGAFYIWFFLITSNLIMYFCLHANISRLVDLKTYWWAIAIGVGILVFGCHGSAHGGFRVSTTDTYDPNDLALILSSTLPFIVGLIRTERPIIKLVLLAEVLISVLIILKTQSRGGLIGLSLCCAAFLFAPRKVLPVTWRVWMILGCLIVVLAGNYEGLWDRLETLSTGEDYNFDMGSGGRMRIWVDALTIVSHNLSFGVGPGQCNVAIGEWTGIWQTAHNSYLQVLVEMGVPALIIFLILQGRIWRNLSTHPGMDKAQTPFAYCLRVSLIVFASCSFFLSQAYSPILPLLLAFSVWYSNQQGGVSPIQSSPPSINQNARGGTAQTKTTLRRSRSAM